MIPGSTGSYSPFVTVKEGKTGQAVELFNQLPQELNDSQRREKTLLAVEIKLAQ
ncbi:hypothetical protein ACLB1S_26785 [Escherichia coli]